MSHWHCERKQASIKEIIPQIDLYKKTDAFKDTYLACFPWQSKHLVRSVQLFYINNNFFTLYVGPFFFFQNISQNKRTLLPKFYGLFCYQVNAYHYARSRRGEWEARWREREREMYEHWTLLFWFVRWGVVLQAVTLQSLRKTELGRTVSELFLFFFFC